MRFAAVIFVIPFGILNTAALAETITEAAFKSEIVGSNWKWQEGKYGGTITYKADGTISVTTNVKGIAKDTGRWWYKGDQFCSSYKKLRKGKEKCITFSKNAGQYQTSSGGRLYK
ncbi:hypothetical protein HPQ64_12465 [Rhizobiales bacterium]|uniref:hypothetical protein n=1 Tax=Hongsoonwoonella zoysiae TaxID=2821844 RepID=UPI00155FEE8A|nr:hypothetical protein [Hongsoonwoonella zoysiae]NRG18503.1 hypothetical protein [Hongsoonwoonella zoysiae]